MGQTSNKQEKAISGTTCYEEITCSTRSSGMCGEAVIKTRVSVGRALCI